MKNLIKSTLLSVALLGAYSAIGADEAVKAAPGAYLYLYDITDAVVPTAESEPITIVADKGEWFSYDNLKKIEETKKFCGQKLFLVWKGFVNIPSPGDYTFSASFLKGPDYHCQTHVSIKLDNKDLLSIFQLGNNGHKGKYKLNDSRSVTIPAAGDYELTVIYRAEGRCYDFTFQMWNKRSPLKKLSIAPSKMVHAE